MSTAAQPTRTTAPAVVPRWEWRTFGDLSGAEPFLASLPTEAPVTSEETYILSTHRDASVKIRGGLLDAKVLTRVNAAGLELWVPTMKAGFPLDEAAVEACAWALGVTFPRRSGLLLDELRELVGSSDDLRAVDVRKTRRHAVLDGCMVEVTELTAGGTSTRTVAVESADPDLVTRTVERLGLAGRANTCVAKGVKSLLGWGPTRYAVLDVGTNSVKLTQGDRTDGGRPDTRHDRAVVTRLGEGQAPTGELTTDAMRRTVDVIAELVDEARRSGPLEIAAVGTAGLRQAPNRDTFVDEVFSRCGVAVEVISGTEEARLAYLAAVSTLPLVGEALLVFDSGGGSSQFTWGRPDMIEEQFSVDVGAVRFTERFGLADAVERATVDRALAAIARDLHQLEARPRPDMVIAIGGTATNLAAVARKLTHYDPDVVHGTVVRLEEVDRQIEDYRSRSAEERRSLPGLQPARAEVILAGACIVRTILALTGQSSVTVSDRGLRHGVAAARFGV